MREKPKMIVRRLHNLTSSRCGKDVHHPVAEAVEMSGEKGYSSFSKGDKRDSGP